MEANWVHPTDLGLRIDAEFYRSELLENERRIYASTTCATLNDLRRVDRPITNGIRGPELSESNFRMLRLQDIDGLWIDSDKSLRISDAQYRANKRAWCLPGDVLVAIGGYIGVVGKVVDPHPQTMGQHSALLAFDSARLDADFALAFFNSSAGAKLLQRYVSGGVQAGINLEDLREIKIPVPPPAVQRSIGNIVRKAERLRDMLRANVRRANRELAQVMQSDPDPILNCTAPAGAWVNVPLLESRLDCSYNSYTATQARDRVRRSGRTRTLGEIARKITCGPFGSTLTADEHDPAGEVVLVQPTDISELLFSPKPGWRIASRTLLEKRLPNYSGGTLLFARVGIYPHCGVLPIGLSAATISSSMIAVQLEQENDPHYYSLFFRSAFGLPLLYAIQKTTAQPTIATDELAAVRVPVPSPDIQGSIGEKMRAAECQLQMQVKCVDSARAFIESLIAGTLEEAQVLRQGEETEAWLKQNPTASEQRS